MSLRMIAPPPDTRYLTRAHLLRCCYAGTLPAEVLDPRDREELVYDLWAAGYTDVEIATHCHMTTYTTGRIRARLGLPARRSNERPAA